MKIASAAHDARLLSCLISSAPVFLFSENLPKNFRKPPRKPPKTHPYPHLRKRPKISFRGVFGESFRRFTRKFPKTSKNPTSQGFSEVFGKKKRSPPTQLRRSLLSARHCHTAGSDSYANTSENPHLMLTLADHGTDLWNLSVLYCR